MARVNDPLGAAEGVRQKLDNEGVTGLWPMSD